MENIKNNYDAEKYIEKLLDNINRIEEHRLYREEQMQVNHFDEIASYRNCIAWIIRINKIIDFIKYAIINAYKYSKNICSPIEKSGKKDMYTFYLEDAVYRVMVCWDMYKQLINQLYNVGKKIDDKYSIYKLIKEINKISGIYKEKFKEVEIYLNSTEHKKVRDGLRNSFTHNIDPTEINIFHYINEEGLLQVNDIGVLPNHPYENLILVLSDIKKLLKFIERENECILSKLENKIMLVEVTMYFKCGKCTYNKEVMNISDLMNNLDTIRSVLKEKCYNCNNLIDEGEYFSCRPKKIKFNRVNELDIKEVEITNY